MSKIFEIPLYPYMRHPDQDDNSARRHKVIVIGAGPVGLTLALDLASRDIPVLVLDDNDRVSFGSRAICFAKRTLEILDRLGCGAESVDKGVTWGRGRVFFDEREIYDFDLLPEDGHKRPAFINLQQYHLEKFLFDRVQALAAAGKPIEIRGRNRVEAIGAHDDHVRLEIETPEGSYELQAEWLVACDGANSPTRRMMGLDFVGRVFEDNFLIADVIMQAEFPTERWFWFDPPFNRGQSALLHRQPDNVWRIDLQLGWDIDVEAEKRPERVIPRLKAMLGEDVAFELDWVSIYTFQCRRMARFRHGRVLFAGDSAHQVSPFGARGANSGIQDADNLGWKLALVLAGDAPEALLDSYNWERVYAADENITHSTRATDFITPKSEISQVFRNAVLDLAASHPFARPLVNSGRLSMPSIYDDGPLNGNDDTGLPHRTRPGAPLCDAPLGQDWLLGHIPAGFVLLAINADCPETITCDRITVSVVSLRTDDNHALAERYLGDMSQAIYLVRPDQHVAARWRGFDQAAIELAVARATARA